MYDWTDTVVGRATPATLGPRAILRVTGGETAAIIGRLRLQTADVLNWAEKSVAQVSIELSELGRGVAAELYVWPQHRSPTGAVAAELHTINSPALLAALELEIIRQGARRALPGEFTLRAFLAGKLDLLQAEGILGLTQAESVGDLCFFIDQRLGGLSRALVAAREELVDLLADLEAGLDFVEEDIRFLTDEELRRGIDSALARITRCGEQLTSRCQEADRLRVVLLGKPNAGKSSLFNALTSAESGRRSPALVSNQPGTTRDLLIAVLELGDRQVELIDTAGDDPEATGVIDGAAAALRESWGSRADLGLLCVPGEDAVPPMKLPADWMIVRTKADLAPNFHDAGACCHVSVRDAASIDRLRHGLAAWVSSKTSSAAGISGRCRDSLERASAALARARDDLEHGNGPELVAVGLRDAIGTLGEIVGAVYTDDLLGRIFSRFCIGK